MARNTASVVFRAITLWWVLRLTVVGLLLLCPAGYAGGRVQSGAGADWIGFQVSLSDSVRGSGGSSGSLAMINYRGVCGLLVFRGFVGVSWLVARCRWASVRTDSDVVV